MERNPPLFTAQLAVRVAIVFALSGLGALCIAAIILMNAATDAIQKIPATIDERSSQAVRAIESASADLRSSEAAILETTAAAVFSADKQVTSANSTVSKLADAAIGVLEETTTTISSVNQAVVGLSETRAGIAPILADVRSVVGDAAHTSSQVRLDADLLLDCEGNPQCLPNRLIGTNQAIERAAQSIDHTMKSVADGVPPILSVALKIGENSDRTTGETAGLMENLRLQTKPLPTWMRIGLAVAPPLAGTAAGVATACVTIGGCK